MIRFLSILMLAACCTMVSVRAEVVPEPSSGLAETYAATAPNYMAVTAHPEATRAAIAILRRGGSALDAAIAAQMVLGVVEPQSSGMGGGGFLLHYDAATKTTTSYDGRETAPAAISPYIFLDEDGAPIPFMDAVRSANSVGVPGLIAMLKQAHDAHGNIAWARLFIRATELAERGFTITPRLEKSIAYAAQHAMSDEWRALYLDEAGAPKRAGTLLQNPALAATLETVGRKRIRGFYQGDVAANIASYVAARGGVLSMQDLRNYEAVERPVTCGTYRDYKICSMAPPSSGGIALLQTLGILEQFDLNQPYSARDVHLVLEAQKIAFADRNRYVADGMEVSPAQLLNPAYLQKRAQEINPEAARPYPAAPGVFDDAPPLTDGMVANLPSTTHISIVDAAGNAVSLTSSVEHSFGAGLVVNGFVLNNQLTDFSFTPYQGNLRVANAIAPNKRPRSSMTPTLIFTPDGELFAVLGSPGGSAIIGYVTKTIVALLDWDMPLQEAINAPNILHNNQQAMLEEGNDVLANALRVMGHEVRLGEQTSGVHAIMRGDGVWLGAADPRREGVALGN